MNLGRTLMSLLLGWRKPAGPTGPAPSTLLNGLVSYWPLSEVSGTRADAVGSNDLTDNNTVGVKLRGPQGTVASPVRANSEELTSLFTGTAGELTGAVWVYWDGSFTAYEGFMRLRVASDTYAYQNIALAIYGNGQQLIFENGSGDAIGVYALVNPAPLTPGWNLLVGNRIITAGQPDIRWSINGSPWAASTTGPASSGGPLTADKVSLCSLTGSNFSDSKQGPSAVWHRSLTDEELVTLFASGNGLKYADLPDGLKTGLVSYWNLDEVSGVRYDSHGSNDLTDNNTVGSVNTGPLGTVASPVYANTEYLHAATQPPSGSGVTMAAWFDWTLGSPSYPLVMGWGDGQGASTDGFSVFHNANTFYVRLSDGTTTVQASYGYPSGDTAGIRFIAASYDFSDKKGRLYIDGVEVAVTAALPSAINSNAYTANFGLGGNPNWVYGTVDGRLGPAGFWGRTIAQPDIAALFNSGLGKRYEDLTTAEKVGLVSYWNLDEQSGVRYDSHGTNHLTDNNTVGSVINAGDAMDGGAASFVAANSEYLNNTAVAIDPSAWTFAHWVKMPSGGGNGIPVDIENLFYYWPSLGQVYVFGTPTTDIGDPPPADGSWHLMIVWQDGSTAGVQVDGNAPQTASLTPKAAANWNMRLVHPSFLLDCQHDEAALWDRVLTADERAELFALGKGKFHAFE